MQSDVCRQQCHQSLRRTIRHNNVTPYQVFCATCFDIRREKSDGEIKSSLIRAQMLCRGKIVYVCKHSFTKQSFQNCKFVLTLLCSTELLMRLIAACCQVGAATSRASCFSCFLFSVYFIFVYYSHYFLLITFCLLLHFHFVLFCALFITSSSLIYLLVL
jgi:hypothetical protein